MFLEVGENLVDNRASTKAKYNHFQELSSQARTLLNLDKQQIPQLRFLLRKNYIRNLENKISNTLSGKAVSRADAIVATLAALAAGGSHRVTCRLLLVTALMSLVGVESGKVPREN
ncbi:hypothetical protein H5410_060232 [Solanum commersonii]|uniref:Uncharacterized protein n=1 Tax=Solanum commersonii TaxID=4109 RepID=A0A9J5W4M9_SOLCO|nr:hypothetical protein H5410_060232 [Solanum commersonii]